MRISDWSSDVCSSDLPPNRIRKRSRKARRPVRPAGWSSRSIPISCSQPSIASLADAMSKVDLSQFHQTFFDESLEGLDAMESALLKLDTGATDAELVNTIFRAAHSIKGGSATFRFQEVAAFTHVAEELLDGVRSGKRAVTAEVIEMLLRCVDALRGMLERARGGQASANVSTDALLAAVGQQLAAGSVASGPVIDRTASGQIGRAHV